MQVEVACMHLTGRFFLRSSQADPCCDRRLGPEGARLCLEPLPASQGLGGDPTARERITTYLSPASRRPIARYSSVASIGVNISRDALHTCPGLAQRPDIYGDIMDGARRHGAATAQQSSLSPVLGCCRLFVACSTVVRW